MALSVLEITALPVQPKTYRKSAGGGLYVVVQPTGSKSYEFRYKRNGHVHAVVIGNVNKCGLAEARKERDRLRGLLAQGRNPSAQRRIAAEEQKLRLAEVKAAASQRKAEAKRAMLTLRVVADAWIAGNRDVWTLKHAEQVEQSFRDHVYPTLGNKPITNVEAGHVLDLLGGLLAEGKVETARRVRQRLDAVFEHAGLRHKLPTNPVAMGKREINKSVKAARKVHPKENFACVPVAEVPQLLRAMRSYVGTTVTRSLLWFVALTGCRTGEARYATWDEFTLDGDDPFWLIPAARMKAGNDHRVPLAPAVIDLLRQLRAATGQRPFVFPHPRRDDRPASENAILYVLAAIGYKDRMTGHGFRSLFSTLANASRLHDSTIIEAALAHGDEDAIRATYDKSKSADEHKALADLYGDARRQLADWYADDLARLEAGPQAKVISFGRRAI